MLRERLPAGGNSPAQDDVVVKEIRFHVLEADGLVEALWDQKPQNPAEVWGVEEGDSDLLWKLL